MDFSQSNPTPDQNLITIRRFLESVTCDQMKYSIRARINSIIVAKKDLKRNVSETYLNTGQLLQKGQHKRVGENVGVLLCFIIVFSKNKAHAKEEDLCFSSPMHESLSKQKVHWLSKQRKSAKVSQRVYPLKMGNKQVTAIKPQLIWQFKALEEWVFA